MSNDLDPNHLQNISAEDKSRWPAVNKRVCCSVISDIIHIAHTSKIFWSFKILIG